MSATNHRLLAFDVTSSPPVKFSIAWKNGRVNTFLDQLWHLSHNIKSLIGRDAMLLLTAFLLKGIITPDIIQELDPSILCHMPRRRWCRKRHTYWRGSKSLQEDFPVTSGDVEMAVETSIVEQAADTTGAQAETSVAKPAPKQKKKVRVLPRARVVKVLSVGMEVAGTVKRVSEFGAFVDIGAGRDGLLHISELSTSRVNKVTDVVQEGQEVTVWIKELDRERNRISLTMIAPGTRTIRDLETGELVTGTVTRLTNYGAFVDIGLERDAMLHVKEMGDGYVAKPEDVVKLGEVIEARISGVDARRGRIDLSLKGLRPSAGDEENATEVYLEPASVEIEDEAPPTSMEMAFRMALSEEDLEYEIEKASRKSGRRRRNNYRDQQDDIVSRTLRYNN